MSADLAGRPDRPRPVSPPKRGGPIGLPEATVRVELRAGDSYPAALRRAETSLRAAPPARSSGPAVVMAHRTL